MRAQVLFIDGCPHHGMAVERLREAVQIVGVDLVIEDHHVADVAEARRLGFGGSPSILLNGHDMFPTATIEDLACRMYPTPAGGLAGAPSVASLVEELRQRLALEPPASAP